MGSCKVHKLIAGVVVLADGKALLVKYKDASQHDGQTGWFHPDDTLADFEEPDDGAARILKEQLGLTADALTFGFFESFKGHDGTHHLMFQYKAQFTRPPRLEPGTNIGTTKWFDVAKLPPKVEVAHHGWANDVITRIATSK